MRYRYYAFRSVWQVDVPPGTAFSVLADVETYRDWWPEVRETRRLSPDSVELRVRALLPYELRFVSERAVEDRAAGVLEARLAGDLEGYSRWTVTASGGGSRLQWDQEVVTNKRMLNLLAPLARPLLRFNHWLMMRRGQAGLRVFLAGHRFATRA